MGKYDGTKLDPKEARDKNAKDLLKIARKAGKAAGTKPAPKRAANEN